MRIVAVHLLNDFSGSPKVLMQLVRGWIAHGVGVTIVTAGNRRGFLSDIVGATYRSFWYRWSANRWLRLVNLLVSQGILFTTLLFSLRRGDIVYINTVLPFGAALAGKVRRCRIVYHVHETSMSPPVLKRFLFAMVRSTASEVVYVSRYLMEKEPAPGKPMHLLPNALEESFINRSKEDERTLRPARSVLMICSLKAYKGVYEFIELARRCPEFLFRLVVNASQQEVERFVAETNPPSCVRVFPVQADVHPFYRQADVVVNLSRPNEWVETFGLTVIESYAYGLPVIVPPVGGIAGLVEEGATGFHVDSADLELLTSTLRRMTEADTYARLATQARAAAALFSEARLIENSLRLLENPAGNSFHPVEKPVPGT